GFTQIKADGVIDRQVADAALRMLDVDAIGLDILDRKLLLAVMEKFGGGPVGVDNLASAISEERDTIEEVLEPYLIQQGFLQRTPRGRVATAVTYQHFNLLPAAHPRQLNLFDHNLSADAAAIDESFIQPTPDRKE